MKLNPGDIILNSKYRVERRLGEGACAQVYLARHLELNVDRAVKGLFRDAPGVGSTQFGDYHARFRLEAQLGAKLDHPHVVKVHDFEAQEDALYLVMEYAPSGSLADLLEQGQLSLNDFLRIALDAALGLGAIHEQLEIVHRDVKPSNILLGAQGRAKIGDLGLAQVEGGMSRRTLLGSAAPPHPGTPLYMSPEQEQEHGHLQYPGGALHAEGTGRAPLERQRGGGTAAGRGRGTPGAKVDLGSGCAGRATPGWWRDWAAVVATTLGATGCSLSDTDADNHTDFHADNYADLDADINLHPHRYAYPDANSYPYGHTNADSSHKHATPYTNTDVHADTNTYPTEFRRHLGR